MGQAALEAQVTAYVGLGANLGDAANSVRAAMNAIDALPDVAIARRSSLYCTAPVDAAGPDYINAVVELSTQLPPDELLVRLQAIENAAVRQRPYRNAPRTLDLDILLYGGLQIDSPSLTVPHPRMNERAFVLVPLAEIAPQLVKQAQLQAVAGQRLQRVLMRF